MTDIHAIAQAEALANIERKDRRFRVAQGIFLGLILGLVIVLLSINYRIQSQNRTLLTQQAALTSQLKEAVSELKANNYQNFATLTQRVNCIADFFAQDNRTDKQLQNLQHCTITQTSSTSPSQDETLNTSPTPIASLPLQESSGSSAQSAQSVPAKPSSPSSPPPVSPGPTPTAPPPPQPSLVQRIVNLVKGLL